MFIGKTALILNENNVNISPAVGIDSLYYEKAIVNGSDVSVIKQNVPSHMAILVYNNGISDVSTLDLSGNIENANYNISSSTDLFSDNMTSYLEIQNGDTNKVEKNIIGRTTNEDIIIPKIEFGSINANTTYSGDDTSYMSVDLGYRKYNLSDLIHNYISQSSFDLYKEWILNKACEEALDASVEAHNIINNSGIPSNISNVSNRSLTTENHYNNLSTNIIDGSIINYREHKYAGIISEFNDQLNLSIGKIYKYEYNANSLHSDILPIYGYMDNSINLYFTAVDINRTNSKPYIDCDTSYFENTNHWNVTFDLDYISKIVYNGSTYYRIDNIKDAIKYYKDSSSNEIISGLAVSIQDDYFPITDNNVIDNDNIIVFCSLSSVNKDPIVNTRKYMYPTIDGNTFIIYSLSTSTYIGKYLITLNNKTFYKVDGQSFIYKEDGIEKRAICVAKEFDAEYVKIKTADVSVFKGKITYMKDEYNNEAPYDFKNRVSIEDSNYTFSNIIGSYDKSSLLYKVSLLASSINDLYSSNKINNFIKNYVNDLYADVSKYINLYSYTINSSIIDPSGNILTSNYSYIDFIFNTDSSANMINTVSHTLSAFDPLVSNISAINLYNKVSFYYNNMVMVDSSLNEVTTNFFNMTSTEFKNLLYQNLNPNTDRSGMADILYTYELPYSKYISKYCAGISDNAIVGTLSNGWKGRFDSSNNEDTGITSETVNYSTYKSEYSQTGVTLGNIDYSLSGNVKNNTINNYDTIIAGDASNNYVGYENTDIRILNNTSNCIENIVISNKNESITINGYSDNITIGNNNKSITILNSSNINIMSENDTINIINSNNLYIHNICKNISIGDSNSISENNIINSSCLNIDMVGNDNLIYLNGNNIVCLSTNMLTIGQTAGSLLFSYHDNHSYYTLQEMSTDTSYIDNYSAVNKLSVIITSENSSEFINAYNASLNAWVIPSKINDSSYLIIVNMVDDALGTYNFYDMDSSLGIETIDGSNFTLSLTTKDEKSYDNWFEYNSEKKLQTNFKLITFNGDTNNPLYINDENATDVGLHRYVHIKDSSKHICTQGMFDVSGNKIYINTSLNSSMCFNIDGYMVPSIYSYKLGNTSTNYIHGSIDNKKYNKFGDSSGNIYVTFDKEHDFSYNVNIRYWIKPSIKYRFNIKSKILNKLTLSFYDKYGQYIDYVNISLMSSNSSFGTQISYYDRDTASRIIKQLSYQSFIGLNTIDGSNFLCWTDGILSRYYLELDSSILLVFTNGISQTEYISNNTYSGNSKDVPIYKGTYNLFMRTWSLSLISLDDRGSGSIRFNIPTNIGTGTDTLDGGEIIGTGGLNS